MKQLQEKILKNEKRLKKTLEIAKLGYFQFNTENKTLIFSPEAVLLLSLSMPIDRDLNLSIKQFLTWIYNDDRKMLSDFFCSDISFYKKNIDFRVKLKGKIKFFAIKLFEDEDINNNSIKNGIIQDISEFKYTQIALNNSQEKFLEILNRLPLIIHAIDSNNNICFWNKESIKIFGYNNEDIKEKKIKIYNIFRTEAGFNRIISRLKKNDNKYLEVKVLNKNKEQKNILYNLSINSPISSWKYLFIGTDITYLKKTQNELVKAKSRAEKADRMKSIFLADMSHDIRNPLSVITSFTKILTTQYEFINDEEKSEFKNIITRNANLLKRLVDDILDFAKIESGQIKISTEQVVLNQIINDLYLQFSKIIEKSGKNIELIAEKELPVEKSVIMTDKTRLSQIFTNLLTNAVKYTLDGKITFGYEFVDNKFIKCYVKDTGIGIDAKQKELMFLRFNQAETQISKNIDGFGLGLAICKKLVHKLGGKIWLESKKNQGTSALFIIPAYNTKLAENKNITTDQLSDILCNKTILIVDDNDDTHLCVKKIMSSFNSKIIHTFSSEETINEVTNNKNIDLILLNVLLPGLNSSAIAFKIKKINPKISIIAHTDYVLESDKKKFENQGFDAYITKPVKKEILFEKIYLLLSV